MVFLDVINAPIIAAWSSFRLLLPIITNYRILLKKKTGMSSASVSERFCCMVAKYGLHPAKQFDN